jgi:sialate O-acetylesterase
MNKRILLALTALMLSSTSRADLRLPGIFGDHMVLQQGAASVWGWAAPGKTITVSLSDQKASAKAGADGKWKASLLALKAGGPFEMAVTGDGSVTLSDVLVGDVWLGSGQSNMEFPLSRSLDASTEITKADYPRMRLFTLDKASHSAPKDDVKGTWKVCSSSIAGEFSAVAYYFGRDIHRSLKVPVGVVAAAWGGTPAEVWVPRAAMEKEPELAQLMKDWDRDPMRTAAWAEGVPYELQISDVRLTPKGGKGKSLAVNLQAAGGSVGSWSCSAVSGSTAFFKPQAKGPQGGLAAVLSGMLKGAGWITLSTPLGPGTFDVNPYEAIEFYAKGKGKYRLKLSQPSIADYNYHSTDIFEAPADWKLMSYPIASLKQGDWGTRKPFTPEAVQALVINPEVPYNPEVAAVAYNGMIAPLTPFKIKGVIWYQGESNWARAVQYQKLLSALVTSWRETWGSAFPFLIVQLPNYQAVSSQPSDTAWSTLREAQAGVARSLPNTGLVTTIDLGEANDIHPKNKKDVGERLATLALGTVYGKAVTLTSPVFEKAQVKGSAMIVRFKNTGGGLAVKGGGPVTGFALGEGDGWLYWADAKIVGEDTVEVTSPKVKEPAELRYACGDNPVCNLSSKEGYPASPLRFSLPPKPGAARPGDDIPPPP